MTAEELHSYCRTTFTAWVTFFTFFVTTNYVGIGWFGAGRVENLGYRRAMITVFLLQNVLATLGGALLSNWIAGIKRKEGVRENRAKGMTIHSLYQIYIWLSIVTMWSLGIVWILILTRVIG